MSSVFSKTPLLEAIIVFEADTSVATSDFRRLKLQAFVERVSRNLVKINGLLSRVDVLVQDGSSSSSKKNINNGSSSSGNRDSNSNNSGDSGINNGNQVLRNLIDAPPSDSIYIASFCPNLKSLYQAIKDTLKRCIKKTLSAVHYADGGGDNDNDNDNDNNDNNNDISNNMISKGYGNMKTKKKIKIIILEDLVWVEHVYISTTPANRFFESIRKKLKIAIEDEMEGKVEVTVASEVEKEKEDGEEERGGGGDERLEVNIEVLSSNEVLNSYGGAVGNINSSNISSNASSDSSKRDEINVPSLLSDWYGDTRVVKIPQLQEQPRFWEEIKDIKFYEMMHRGGAVPRLVAIQSLRNAHGGRPLYRHPNDQEPPNSDMDPVVIEILKIVEEATGVRGINHVLIQHYRDGFDNIQQHSDKTLDINRDTPILNLSFGCNRDMYIQNKTDRLNIEKIPLRCGECVVFGMATNQYWLHEVPKDAQMKAHPIYQKSRISFTFRRVDTFVDTATGLLYGQGSPYKSLSLAIEAANSGSVLQASVKSADINARVGVDVSANEGKIALSDDPTNRSETHHPIAVGQNADMADDAFRFLAKKKTEDTEEEACLIKKGAATELEKMNLSTSTSNSISDSNSNSSSINSRADMIHAFHLENRQASEFNWETVYGRGFLEL